MTCPDDRDIWNAGYYPKRTWLNRALITCTLLVVVIALWAVAHWGAA